MRGLRWGVLALVLFAAGSAWAQAPGLAEDARRALLGDEAAPAPESFLSPVRVPSAQAGVIDPQRYIVGPGDRFELQLRGRLLRTTALTVDPEGRVSLPEGGLVPVAGLNLAEARVRVRERLARSFQGVEVELRLVQPRSFKVFVTGDVDHPGAYEVQAGARTSEVMAMAKAHATAATRNIHLRHRDGSVATADLGLLDLAGDPAGDAPLLDGDVVEVPVAREFIASAGALGRPGRFERVAGDSLSTLLRLSGGLLPSSDLDAAVLVRFTSPTARETLNVPLRGANPVLLATPLRDGDVLFVYYLSDFHQVPAVNIVGEVTRPGSYPISVGHDRISDLVSWSGGLTARANTHNLVLIRNPEGVKDGDADIERLGRLSREQMTESEYIQLQTRLAERKNTFRVDLERIRERPSGENLDLLLRDGDIVRVDRLVTSVRVDGQVRHPGLVEFVPGRSSTDYVRLAGGFTDRASAGSVRITRALNGQVVPARGVRDLQPGDFIWVPERREHDPWVVFRDVLAVAGQIAVIIVAVRR